MCKLYYVLSTFLFLGLVLTSCSKDSNDDSLTLKMPTSLVKGNEIILSKSSPMSFGFFRVTSTSTGQWCDKYEPIIAERFSSATYTYQITGENTAYLNSINYQSMTGRTWSIDLYLTFETHNSGTYVLRDVALGSGTSYETKGTFTFKSEL